MISEILRCQDRIAVLDMAKKASKSGFDLVEIRTYLT